MVTTTRNQAFVPRRSVPHRPVSDRARQIHARRAQPLRRAEVIGPANPTPTRVVQPSRIDARWNRYPGTLSFEEFLYLRERPILSARLRARLSRRDATPVVHPELNNLIRQEQLLEPLNPEARRPNPPHPYSASQTDPTWSSPQGLWNAYKTEIQHQRYCQGKPTVDLKGLSDFRHLHFWENKVFSERFFTPIGASITLPICVARLLIFPAKGPAAGETEGLLITRVAIQEPTEVIVGGRSQRGFVLKYLLPVTMKRGALDTFFKPTAPKKPKYEASTKKSSHASYPFAIPHLPAPFSEQLGFAPAEEGKLMNDQLDLDLVYYQPYIPSSIATGLFELLRQELPFYRVQYNIKRGGIQTQINTPRFTTVFGVDETSRFAPDGSLIDTKTGKPIEKSRYKCTPRPIPQCLEELKKVTEGTTGETFNFCLVNYYADGKDSISYHSDDERFLGSEPAIASFSLGAKRDFLMKHKPIPPKDGVVVEEPKGLKLPLGSGDMVLMRGKTQANWLHSIPKRAGGDAGKGRINITFRRAMVRAGTENYYQYNVGVGEVLKWDKGGEKMVPWVPGVGAEEEAGGVQNGE